MANLGDTIVNGVLRVNGKVYTGSISGIIEKALADGNNQNIANTYIKSLSVSGKTITYTKGDNTTGTITTQDTTYTGTNGVTVSGTTISNSGVRSIATGTANGTISVNTNGTTTNVSVKGLGSLAYKSSLTASDVSAIPTSAKGTASGVAELDSNGKVPSAQLPSYVDDVAEYSAKANFPTTGETGKIYVDTSTNLTYRWSGSAYVEISPSLALGTTSSTAFRGDYGNISYVHAVDASKLTTATASGLYKVASTANGHIASLTAVTKSDITGLGIPASNTTYTLTQDSTDGHKITLTPSSGTATTITIPDNNTVYTFSNGLSASGTTVSNSGVRSISSGDTNGTIKVNTNGTAVDVTVKGLADAAYKGVDTTLASGSTSTNVPTSKAVADLFATLSSSSGGLAYTDFVIQTHTVTGSGLSANNGANFYPTLSKADYYPLVITSLPYNATQQGFEYSFTRLYNRKVGSCTLSWYCKNAYNGSKTSVTVSIDILWVKAS